MSGHRILLTGGAGFIASHLAEALVEKNELVLFDSDFQGKPIQFTRLQAHPNVRLVKGDILDAAKVLDAAKGCDTVVHMAAVVGVQNVLKHPKQTIEVNFLGTRNALEAACINRNLWRFIYFSTSEVFGGSSFRVEENHFATVGSVAEARWSYSIAKLAGEHLAFAYYREHQMPVVIVRPFNIFGPRRTGDHAMLQFIVRALRNEPLEVHGDGSQIRSWCYIADFVDALLRCLERPEAVGQDFNVGNGRNTCTIFDLAQRIVALTGSKSEIRPAHIDFADIDLRVPRPKKSRDLLGFEAHWDLERALRATIDWYSANLTQINLRPTQTGPAT